MNREKIIEKMKKLQDMVLMGTENESKNAKILLKEMQEKYNIYLDEFEPETVILISERDRWANNFENLIDILFYFNFHIGGTLDDLHIFIEKKNIENKLVFEKFLSIILPYKQELISSIAFSVCNTYKNDIPDWLKESSGFFKNIDGCFVEI